MYGIEFSVGVWDDMKPFPSRDQRILMDAMEEQLAHQPGVRTKNRKDLVNLVPPWRFVPPVWELRAGDYRVFYDLDEEKKIVYVRAIRLKPPHKRTEDIL